MSTSPADCATRPCPVELAGLAARHLALLDAIARHPGALAGNTSTLAIMLEQTRAVNADLIDHTPDGGLGDHQEASEQLKLASDCVVRLYRSALQARRTAKQDPAARRRGVIDPQEAWTTQVAVLANLHNAMEDLRDTIETIDCLASPMGGRTYTCVDEMFRDLEVG